MYSISRSTFFPQSDPHTPLRDDDIFAAAKKGDLAVLECAADWGARLSEVTQQGVGLLQIAVEAPNAELIALLVRNMAPRERAAYVNATLPHRDSSTALHLAAQHGYTDAVRKLIQAGAHLELRNCQGKTALHLAIESGHFAAASRLVQAGADANAVTKNNRTPLDLAVHSGNLDLFAPLVQTEANMVHALVDGNAQIVRAAAELALSEGTHDQNALPWALNKAGIDTHCILVDNVARLLMAAYLGHREALSVLASKDVNLNAMRAGGTTAFLMVAQSDMDQDEKFLTMHALFEHGADPKTALANAIEFNQTNVVREIGRYCLNLVFACQFNQDSDANVNAGEDASRFSSVLKIFPPDTRAALLATLPFGIYAQQIENLESLDEKQAERITKMLDALHKVDNQHSGAAKPLFNNTAWASVAKNVRQLDKVLGNAGEGTLTKGNVAKHISHLPLILDALGVAP
jgi:ankyrin repeat protein